MSQLKFKTNIECNGCKAAVSRIFENEKRISKWDVDLESNEKILTVEGNNITAREIEELVAEAGFNAKEV